MKPPTLNPQPPTPNPQPQPPHAPPPLSHMHSWKDRNDASHGDGGGGQVQEAEGDSAGWGVTCDCGVCDVCDM